MSSENDRGFNIETIYKQLSRYPTKSILIPALKAGALSGTTGLLTGGVAAVLRSSPTPTLFTVASGIQWFALGGTFSATRSTLLWHWNIPSPTPQDRVAASSYAGGMTGGTIGALFRGHRNILPGALVFTFFGYMGQTVYNKLDARYSKQDAVERQKEKEEKKGFWNKVADMEWSPMKKLSDEEYGNMLKERLLRVEADIALVDEELEKLRIEERVTNARDENIAVAKKNRESR